MPNLAVPHIKQNGESHCGVACLEMVYRFFGITEVTQDDIWTKRNTIRPDGTSRFMKTSSMVDDLVEKRFRVLWGQLSLDPRAVENGVKNLVTLGIPIIACIQWANNPLYGHFVVIIGIDNNQISYLDPERDGEQKKDIGLFINQWKSTGEEVIGGQFIIATRDHMELPLEALKLVSFEAPNLKDFQLRNLSYE